MDVRQTTTNHRSVPQLLIALLSIHRRRRTPRRHWTAAEVMQDVEETVKSVNRLRSV